MLLKNKNIFISGAGKGIGFALTLEALKEGAFVYALIRSRKDGKKFKNLRNIKIFYGDIKNNQLIKKIILQSIKDKKEISGVINNAGIRQRLDFNKIRYNDLKKIFENNFFSVFFVMQLFAKYFIKYKVPINDCI